LWAPLKVAETDQFVRILCYFCIATALWCNLLTSQQLVGTTDVSWTNTSGNGTAVLDARVHYPAVASGVGARMVSPPRSAGFPVIVFLHGYAVLGNDYPQMGDAIAEAGYIAVMLNTALFSHTTMEFDTQALFGAMALETNDPQSPFFGKLDLQRAGLMGHSMGASVIVYLLNEDPSTDPTTACTNPGYSCGLALAPVDPALASSFSPVVEVPIGCISGLGDTLTPPVVHALPFYQSIDPVQGFKFHYMFGTACDHLNMCGLTPNNPAVFDRVTTIFEGFFGHFMQGSLTGLEGILGVDGQSDPNLSNFQVETYVPQTWAADELYIGQTSRISISIEGVFGLLLAANTLSFQPVPTPFGDLLIDPVTVGTFQQGLTSTERYDATVSVPNNPALIGVSFAVQGASPTATAPFRLGSAVSFVIQP
jgi:dienelactone hydrolase